MKTKKILNFLALFFLIFSFSGLAQEKFSGSSLLDDLARLKNYQRKRISSYDRSGKNSDALKIQPGETAELARIEGAGIIKHIWITVSCPDPMIRRNAVLRMYWDGEKNPSVECPLGDFFGQGWGEKYNYVSLPLAAAPGGGNALNSYFPMPFSQGALITLENQSDQPIGAFYYYIDYEQHKTLPADLGRFHAFWNRELTEPGPDGENEWSVLGPQSPNLDGARNYLIADIEGKGQFVGINYYVDNPSPMWYGEGDDMFFIDGEKWPPSLHGTGTEDFFNSSWSPKEIYQHPYFGYARVNNETGWLGRTHCYRFFLESPITFEKSLRATIEHGHNNCLALDLVTVAYWYQKEPHKPFPALRPKQERQNLKPIGVVEIHRWRETWRQSQGGGKLWGNEVKEEKK
ncbi:MAG: glycoside hydrolase family 172 protein [Candidatus Saccharicenans sp.]|uniref:glycoside hydrolase family 172 protein n=1 Tax=Candidatus Saccharicenans sp. TaxID=2819258 RepID=UPI0040498846